MNLANKITIFRVLMLPIYVFCMVYPFENHYIVAGIIFIVASLSDTLDGYIARKYNMVTDLGKFLDPLADKLLVLSALFCFTEIGLIPAFIGVIIISREMLITSLRTLAAMKNRVLAADTYGKLKTVFQLVSLTLFHFLSLNPVFKITANVLLYIALALTLISGANYLIKNKDVFVDN